MSKTRFWTFAFSPPQFCPKSRPEKSKKVLDTILLGNLTFLGSRKLTYVRFLDRPGLSKIAFLRLPKTQNANVQNLVLDKLRGPFWHPACIGYKQDSVDIGQACRRKIRACNVLCAECRRREFFGCGDIPPCKRCLGGPLVPPPHPHQAIVVTPTTKKPKWPIS